jgi:polyisoprenoid-binding protein YceI
MNRYCHIGVTVAAAALLPLVLAQKADEKPKAGAGGAETYQVDPVHSSNTFRIKHMNVAYFHGRFNDMAGTFVFDDADPAKCSFDVQVKVDSVDTNNAGRDKHLKSAELFDAEKFPQITFKSTSVKKAGDQTYDVTGDLTLHGVTKPITVKIERTGAGPGMKGEYRSGCETTFEIKRSDYGMKAMIGPLGDEVHLTVSLEGIRQ